MRHSSSKRTRAAVLVAAGLLLPLAACGDDGDDEDTTATTAADAGGAETTAAPEDAGGSGIVIASFAFNEATVAAGSTVTVTNEDGTPHTVASDDDSWEEVSVSGGESGELTAPSEPGDYAYHCGIHSSMTGTLTVE